MKVIEVACIAMTCLLAGCGKSSHPLVGTWRYDGSAPVGAVDRARAKADASLERLVHTPLVPADIVADGEAKLSRIRRRRALNAELQFRADGTVTQKVKETKFAEPQVTHGAWKEMGQMGRVYTLLIRWEGAAETEQYEFGYEPAQEGVEDPTYISLDVGEVGGVSEISFELVPET